ncbi:hypothetical protein Anapl_18479 [Anas platyrhynchos]|uniref:Uncharacterized protein n=1 Tax=Anas platyrhynchos TaxID=8839 RepID=R0LSI7_ANAPL|nr:hypothetical protein Anapl_18479 [Anas platyrhynchos]
MAVIPICDSGIHISSVRRSTKGEQHPASPATASRLQIPTQIAAAMLQSPVHLSTVRGSSFLAFRLRSISFVQISSSVNLNNPADCAQTLTWEHSESQQQCQIWRATRVVSQSDCAGAKRRSKKDGFPKAKEFNNTTMDQEKIK